MQFLENVFISLDSDRDIRFFFNEFESKWVDLLYDIESYTADLDVFINREPVYITYAHSNPENPNIDLCVTNLLNRLYKEAETKQIKMHQTRTLTNIEMAAEMRMYYMNEIQDLKAFFGNYKQVYADKLNYDELINLIRKWFEPNT